MRNVNNVTACGLLVRGSDPSQIFIERKFRYPSKAVDGNLCFEGGNWWDEKADSDGTPLGTFLRELVVEELELRTKRTSTLADMREMGELDGSQQIGTYETPSVEIEVSEADKLLLEVIKGAIKQRTEFFGAYVIRTDRQYFLSKDPNDKRGKEDLSTLCFYFYVRLTEEEWASLVYLQRKFGNLSNESTTLITNLAEMLAANATETDPYKRFDAAWSHGHALRDYFLALGLYAKDLAPAEFTSGMRVWDVDGTTPYEVILEKYDVEKRPPRYQKQANATL